MLIKIFWSHKKRCVSECIKNISFLPLENAVVTKNSKIIKYSSKNNLNNVFIARVFINQNETEKIFISKKNLVFFRNKRDRLQQQNYKKKSGHLTGWIIEVALQGKCIQCFVIFSLRVWHVANVSNVFTMHIESIII